MRTYNLNILGSKWKLKMVPRVSNPVFETLDGYTDRSTRTIYVADGPFGEMDDFADYEGYAKVVKRHEIIHAFLDESGLAQCMMHSPYGHSEQSVDWMAIQFPKLLDAFKAADAI